MSVKIPKYKKYKPHPCKDNCGRDAEYRSQYCADCSATRRQVKQDVYRYDWKMNHPDRLRANRDKNNAVWNPIKSLHRGTRRAVKYFIKYETIILPRETRKAVRSFIYFERRKQNDRTIII